MCKKHLCSICNKEFSSSGSMKGHKSQQHDRLEKTIKNQDHEKIKAKCDQCGQIMRKTSLKEHQSRKHTSVTKFPCNLSDFQCKSKGYLKKHNFEVHKKEV